MDQREQFVLDYLTGDYPKGALCAVYGITGDAWPGGPKNAIR